MEGLVAKSRYEMEDRSKGPEYRVYLTLLGMRYNLKLYVKLLQDMGECARFNPLKSLQYWALVWIALFEAASKVAAKLYWVNASHSVLLRVPNMCLSIRLELFRSCLLIIDERYDLYEEKKYKFIIFYDA